MYSIDTPSDGVVVGHGARGGRFLFKIKTELRGVLTWLYYLLCRCSAPVASFPFWGDLEGFRSWKGGREGQAEKIVL